MVLSRILCVLLVTASITGCNQSLFDAHGNRRDGGPPGDDGGGDGGGGDGPDVPDMCPAGACIADAASDYNGAQGGKNSRWRYLEDRRNRTWREMTGAGSDLVGLETNNRIGPCGGSSTAGCQALPGALLVSSSGQAFDPAIEYTAADARVINLAVRVRVDAVDHRVRLYRNSREDVLSTVFAVPGTTVEIGVTVDALPDDRFYVALEPTGGLAGTAALHFYIIDANTSFPKSCQLAVPFTVPGTTANTVRDLCGNREILSRFGNASSMPGFRDDPLGRASAAAYLEPDLNYVGSGSLDRTGDLTVQLWILEDSPAPYPEAWAFSDLDNDMDGGLGVHLRHTNPVKLEAVVIGGTPPVYEFQRSVDYPNPTAWHFVRVVHTSSAITICLDGLQVMSAPAPAPRASSLPPTFARNGPWDTSTYLYGGIDDVRVFSGALPCN